MAIVFVVESEATIAAVKNPSDIRAAMHLGRARVVACLLAAGIACPGGMPAAAEDPAHSAHLHRPADWSGTIVRASAARLPVVVMFSTPGCPFCKRLRDEHLRHLEREAATRGVVVAELSMTDHSGFESPPPAASNRGHDAGVAGAAQSTVATRDAPLPAFAESNSPAEVAQVLGIRLAPTVVFLGACGELAPRLVGYGSPDFYGAYLDERIETSRTALQNGCRAAPP